MSHALVLAFLANIGMSDVVSLDMQEVQVLLEVAARVTRVCGERRGTEPRSQQFPCASPTLLLWLNSDPTQSKSETLSRRNSVLRAPQTKPSSDFPALQANSRLKLLVISRGFSALPQSWSVSAADPQLKRQQLLNPAEPDGSCSSLCTITQISPDTERFLLQVCAQT